jgi:nicotinamidase-related amidase
MNKVLFVIDMQNVCVGKNHANLFHYDNETLIKNVNSVISEYAKDQVIYIENIMKDNFINRFAPFKAFEGSDEVLLVEGLSIVNDIRIKKYKGDAFTNPELYKLLKDKGIDEIELTGVDGGGCVAMTAFGAIKAGFKVIVNRNAVGITFQKQADKYNKKLERLGARFI